MIKRKSEAYFLIKKHIVKLAAIQEATGYSPFRLVNIFLRNHPISAVDANSDTAYKYFLKHLRRYKAQFKDSSSHDVLVNHIKKEYLEAKHLGENFSEAATKYLKVEDGIKSFLRDAYKCVYPITSEMSPSEIGARNQRLGKLSTKTWIGDIFNYQFINDAPRNMIVELQQYMKYLDSFILIFFMNGDLDDEANKIALNHKLESKLFKTDGYIKTKLVKI